MTIRTKREVNGILLLNKPAGVTSNAALQRLKKFYQAKKAGHTGSLDPLATGMLPICFGQATKFSQFLLETNKEYVVTAKLGIKTTSGDAEGEVLSQKEVPVLSRNQLETICEKFQGEITQIPSMFSALKYQGKPLYYYARQGIEVPKKIRKATIYHLDLIEHDNIFFTLKVSCSKGTYIRTLIDDMGDELGCGAHVIALHRTTVGHYSQDQMIHLHEIEEKSANLDLIDGLLLPVDSALTGWAELSLPDSVYYFLRQGQSVMVPHAPTEGWVKLSSPDGKFLGLGEILSDGKVAPRRLVSCTGQIK